MDCEDRVLGVLAGQPDDPEWGNVAAAASAALDEARVQCGFAADGFDHRRGTFAAVARGVSFGGGQTVCAPAMGGGYTLSVVCKVPGTLRNDETVANALTALCKNQAVQRIAGFGSSKQCEEWHAIFTD